MKRILVIDDEEAIRKSFALALEDTGYKVDTVESGEKGIDMGKKHKYDLIFLDLKMPGLSGVETLQQLRKIDQKVPIYIVTSFFKDFFDELKSIKKKTDFEVARKPIGGDEIILVTKSILERPASYY